MRVSKIQEKACQVLRRRVNLTDARLSLPGKGGTSGDTKIIRRAVELYIKSWVEPIIDALETGDTIFLRQFASSRGLRMKEENPNDR